MSCPVKDCGVLRALIDHHLRDFHKFPIDYLAYISAMRKVNEIMKLFVRLSFRITSA